MHHTCGKVVGGRGSGVGVRVHGSGSGFRGRGRGQGCYWRICKNREVAKSFDRNVWQFSEYEYAIHDHHNRLYVCINFPLTLTLSVKNIHMILRNLFSFAWAKDITQQNSE